MANITQKPKSHPIDYLGYHMGTASSKDRALKVLRQYYGDAVKSAKLSRGKRPVWHPVFN
jgi:hypothetical protein